MASEADEEDSAEAAAAVVVSEDEVVHVAEEVNIHEDDFWSFHRENYFYSVERIGFYTASTHF